MENLRSAPKAREKAEQLLGEFTALSELAPSWIGEQAATRMMRLKSEMESLAESNKVRDDLREACAKSAAWFSDSTQLGEWRNALAEATVNFRFLVGDLKDEEAEKE